ncbi:MAG: ferrochelatase [Cyclobacteriaceae bacterium]
MNEDYKEKTGVLLINLGTPDTPSVRDVRSYLSQFLNDPRVIDIPWLLRKILVNLIIVPFRAPKSAKVYKELWTDKGSPLIIYSERAAELLQESLDDSYEVYLAMRYKNPSIPDVLEKMRKANYDRIILLPMFPQFASASTDHILFSYHGLPERQVDKVYDEGLCSDRDCEREITYENKYCYKATCYATTRMLAEKLNISEDRYTVCFQSRLDKNWIEPFSDVVVKEQARKGAKKLLVFSPAFTADCLETIIEIGDEYQELFEEHGGEKVQLVESLNDHPLWISCLKDLVVNC